MNKNTNGLPERRKYPRYPGKKNLMVFDTATFGTVINISMGGILFKSLVHNTDQLPATFQLGLLSHKGDYYLDNLNCQVISISTEPPMPKTKPSFIRQTAVKFTDLNSSQKTKLQYFINHNSDSLN